MANLIDVKTPMCQNVNGKSYRLLFETTGDQVGLTQQGGITTDNAQAEFEALRTLIATLEGEIEQLKSIDAIRPPVLVNSDGDIPTTYAKGDSWRVGTAGTYRGFECDVSDLIVALVDRAGADNANNDFYVLQGNLIKAVTGPLSATADNIALFDGGTGTVIKDSGVSVTSVSDAISKSHAHANKETVLDKLSDSDSKLQYNGKDVGGKYGAYVTVDADDPRFTDAVAALELSDGAYFTIIKEA